MSTQSRWRMSPSRRGVYSNWRHVGLVTVGQSRSNDGAGGLSTQIKASSPSGCGPATTSQAMVRRIPVINSKKGKGVVRIEACSGNSVLHNGLEQD
ncbi:hypothetical protein GGI35DRAFT_355298 [Trichoderma velutinum]